MTFFNNLKIGKKIIVGYIAILILMVTVTGVLLASLNNSTKEFDFLIKHDQPVLSNAHLLQKLVVDMETGMRGFLITGKEIFLEPYQSGNAQFDLLIEVEKQLVSDNPAQVAALEEIWRLHEKWITVAAKPIIAKRREMDANLATMNDVARMVQSGIGKNILDEIRDKFTVFVQTEEILNAKRVQDAEENVIFVRNMTLFLALATIIIGILLGVFISRTITHPLVKLTEMAQKMAKGVINQMLNKQSRFEMSEITVRRDEIGLMGNAFNEMFVSFQRIIDDVVQVSGGLAKGDLSVIPEVQYKGDFAKIETGLNMSLANLRAVIADIVQMSQNLAEGKDQAVAKTKYRGDFVQIKEALEIASAKLLEARISNDRESWLKTGQGELNNLISGEQKINVLAKKVISFLTTYSGGQIGLFYLIKKAKETPYLELIASYAYTNSDHRPHQFSMGEGLVGQAALEQKTVVFTQNREDCPSITSSGLANVQPHYVLIFPLLYEGEVKGVIEIGASEALLDSQMNFLEQVMPIVGIAINTTESRDKMGILLDQSQRQTEELQVQSEELRSKTESLEHQQKELQHSNEELQVQSEELQTQQEELRQSNEELSSRTRDLEEQKVEINKKNTELEKSKGLIQAKAKEVELASKYKSEFLANMSHELRTPLNSLLILAQILSENRAGNLSEKQVGYTKTIHSAGSDLLRLINEILDLSKVEAGRIEIHIESLTIGDLIEATEHKFRPMMEQKGLKFKVSTADDFPGVLHTDAHRLQQIINNLLSNALKFTSQGSITLSLSRPAEHIDNLELKTDKILAVSVSDTGLGIPKDKQQVVFEAFQQADGTTSRKFGGTGLGLSISRQLSRLLGGDLVVQSEEGKGSTFILYLPEEPPKVESKPVEKHNPAVPQPVPQIEKVVQVAETEQRIVEEEDYNDDRKNLKPEDKSILIIEDDRKFTDILVSLLHERDFKAIVAEDGSTGLLLAERYKPNAIILDVGLPKLDGWGVMERLKDNPEIRHIPVHFMSASDQSQDAKRMGAIGYSSKPVNMGQLDEAFKKIEKFINNSVKKVLLVTNRAQRKQQILDLIQHDGVKITVLAKHVELKQQLQKTNYDCIIVDTSTNKKVCTMLLEQFSQETHFNIPVIVYADRELTHEEEVLLKRCESRITIKSVHSPERLLDETTLFLHQLEAKLSKEKQKMLRLVHDKEAILENKKVMIVDDDIRNTFALMSFLEGKNMEVVVANHGKEALELLAEKEHKDIVLVLMDIMMPEMDGYETMQKIREQLKFRKLPIIALTAKAMKGDKGKCIEAGANDYVPKPVDTDKLLSLMRVWLYR